MYPTYIHFNEYSSTKWNYAYLWQCTKMNLLWCRLLFIYRNRHFNVMVYHNDLSKLVSSYLVQNVASLIIICLKLYSNIMKNSIQISIKIKMRILTTSRHGCEMRSLLYIIYWTLRYPFAKSTSKLLTRKFWKLDLYTFYY